MSYTLDNVDDSFNFSVEGKEFTMTFPLMEDLESLQEIAEKQKLAEKEKDLDLAKDLAKQVEDFIFGFISPVNGDEDIKSVMKRQNIRTMRNFNVMIKTELGIAE